MPEEKMIQVSSETIYSISTALNSIRDLASAVYRTGFSDTFDGALDSPYHKGLNRNMQAYIWMLDNYDSAAAAFLSISTLADFASEIIPN